MIRSAGGEESTKQRAPRLRLEGTHQDPAQERTHRGTKEEGWRERRKAGDHSVTEPQGGTGEAQCGVQGQLLLGRQ